MLDYINHNGQSVSMDDSLALSHRQQIRYVVLDFNINDGVYPECLQNVMICCTLKNVFNTFGFSSGQGGRGVVVLILTLHTVVLARAAVQKYSSLFFGLVWFGLTYTF